MKNQKLSIYSLFVLCTVGSFYSCEKTSVESNPTVQEEIHENESMGNEIFTVVENMPIPEGGMDAFLDNISKNVKYPDSAREMGIEGKVFVQFVVSKTGRISDVKPVKGIGGGCDEEAVRLFQEEASWSPGLQRGRNVNVRLILPVKFKLPKE